MKSSSNCLYFVSVFKRSVLLAAPLNHQNIPKATFAAAPENPPPYVIQPGRPDGHKVLLQP